MSEIRFERQIFMGSGEHSLALVGRLYQLLYESIDLIGGLQQNPSCWEKPCPEEDERRFDDELRLQDNIKQIFTALSGHKIDRDFTKIVQPKDGCWVGPPQRRS